MKYKHYEYIGAKIGVPLYYCMEEDKFYLHQVPVVSAGWMISGVVFLSGLLSLKKWNDIGLPYNEAIFIWGSIIIGGCLGVAITISTHKILARYFAQMPPAEPPTVQVLKKIVLHEWGMNVVYILMRPFLFLVLLVVPIMMREERNLILLLGYPITCVIEAWLITDTSVIKRIKMLIKIRKLYIRNQEK